MIARTTRDALAEAERRCCVCEAVKSKPFRSRAAASLHVPKGGLLVKQDDGTFVPLRLVPKEAA